MEVLSAVIGLPAAVKYSTIGIWLPRVFLLKEQKYEEDFPHCRQEDKQDCGNYRAKLVTVGFHQTMFGYKNNVEKKEGKERKKLSYKRTIWY